MEENPRFTSVGFRAFQPNENQDAPDGMCLRGPIGNLARAIDVASQLGWRVISTIPYPGGILTPSGGEALSLASETGVNVQGFLEKRNENAAEAEAEENPEKAQAMKDRAERKKAERDAKVAEGQAAPMAVVPPQFISPVLDTFWGIGTSTDTEIVITLQRNIRSSG